MRRWCLDAPYYRKRINLVEVENVLMEDYGVIKAELVGKTDLTKLCGSWSDLDL